MILHLIGDFSPVILWWRSVRPKTKLLFDKKCFHQHLQGQKTSSYQWKGENRGTTFIQWTCHSYSMQLYDWVAWLPSLDGFAALPFLWTKTTENHPQLLIITFFKFASTGNDSHWIEPFPISDYFFRIYFFLLLSLFYPKVFELSNIATQIKYKVSYHQIYIDSVVR